MIAALAVAILFLVFIAYEIAGASSWLPDLHTVSYFAYRNPLIKFAILIVPPALFQLWWLWHMSSFVPK